MLRRLNVRTRLVAVILLPLVLLLAVTVPAVLERRERAGDASQAADITTAIDDVAAAADALQGERTVSAALRAGAGPSVARALDDQRATTDGAVERASVALAALAADHDGLRASASAAAGQLDELDQIRAEIDTAVSEVPWNDPFAGMIGALLQVQEDAAAVTDDLGVGEGLSSVALLARMKDATATQGAQMAAATTWGELRGDQNRILTGLRADEAAYRAAYLGTSPTAVRDERREELLTPEATTAGRIVDRAVNGTDVPTLSSWLDLSDARQEALRGVEAERAIGAGATAELVASTSTTASQGYLLLAGAGLLVAFALALAAARSITRPLRELTVAADRLAQERLPQLVDALRHPADDDEHYLSAAMEPIEVRSDDELGHLAAAFNTVQSVAVDVAAEQASLLKKGISDLYVNLARRNQALIDRQIQHLDELEREEQDPEVLEHLYLLDHLATRMRRNAESLLILAGAESGPRRATPVPLVDVVRAAVSEVEEYERVELGGLADATLQGPAVSDVAHLVSELLENATHFSPPETTVRVEGSRTGGSYQLVVTDRGVGMRAEQLDDLNAILRDPPVTGLALGRSLGCLVAARLAARHGITVRLRPAEGEGIAAYVIVPRHLLAMDVAAPPDPAPSVPTPRALVPPAPATSLPGSLADALPRADFDASLQALLASEPEAELDVRSPAVADAVPEAAMPGPSTDGPEPTTVVPEPTPPEPPSASMPGASTLTRRIPGATTEALPPPRIDPPVRRSPDEVRALLSRYRSGLQAGRTSDDPSEEVTP
ncbi:MAG: nitrate- and nitrite sensing domain-containing protein [Acidimicrobiales bacterium]